MIHASVDIESLGTSYGSIVLSIGAVAFEPHGTVIRNREAFHANISVADSLRSDFTVDGDTFYWWWNRDTRARNGVMIPEPVSIAKAFHELAKWYINHHCEAVWSHRFDMNLLDAYYKKLLLSSPWGYRKELDIRTLFNIAAKFGYKRERTRDKDKHHPVFDATRQAKQIQTANEYIMKGEQP